MNSLKKLIAVVLVTVSFSSCIIVPVGPGYHRHYHHHHYHHYYR